MNRLSIMMLVAFGLVAAATPAAPTSAFSSAAAAAAAPADVKRPRPFIDFPAKTVFPGSVVLTGVATDNVGVFKVRVSIRDKKTLLWLQKNGSWGPDRAAWSAELSTQGDSYVTWTHRVSLPPGKYRLDVRAKDASGNVRRLKPRRTFFVDDAAPAFPLLATAGDVSRCTNDNDEATAVLLDGLFAQRWGVVGILGDSVYPDGSAQQFAECFDPTWGRHAERTKPAVGNHEYKTADAAGYFGYFSVDAGPAHRGWYAYDLGEWRVIVLNTNCSKVGGCGAASDQGTWLAAELAANATTCTVAMSHHPRFSSGKHGPNGNIDDLWRMLAAGGVDIMMSGHDHNYERFEPLNAAGAPDPNGTVQFVVGTGGTALRPVPAPSSGSQFHDDSAHGVLSLELRSGQASYAFHPTGGGAPLDAGTIPCN